MLSCCRKYSTPFPLEDFLVPPQGGFDWRLPTEYCELEWEQYANRSWTRYRNERRVAWHEMIERPEHIGTRFIFANTNLAIRKVGGVFQQETGEDLDDLWPGIFRRFFIPSPALRDVIKKVVSQNGLVPGTYAAAHVRARFPVGLGKIKYRGGNEISGVDFDDSVTKDWVTKIGDNAVKCATVAMPDTKHVYVASDSFELSKYFMNKNNTTNASSSSPADPTQTVSVVMRPDYETNAKHFNGDLPGPDTNSSEYFSTFVDLWLLSHSKCLAHGLGGFGHFASVLSGYHNSCRVRHRSYLNDGAYLPECPTPAQMNVIRVQDAKLKVEAELRRIRLALEEAKTKMNDLNKTNTQIEAEKKLLMEQVEAEKQRNLKIEIKLRAMEERMNKG